MKEHFEKLSASYYHAFFIIVPTQTAVVIHREPGAWFAVEYATITDAMLDRNPLTTNNVVELTPDSLTVTLVHFGKPSTAVVLLRDLKRVYQ
ncbi:hypothetical protein [Spirosoma sordidisoli]|uniref:Uncharacterized protein n=1 Tax=Spirosoma sordidisoli TaxID=2502893 RepID=A0A4Q2UPA7_9BACT|nr:hypothetical protein [Spirosoma sordidisoli]RYC70712.1 hypothetical protein EQG79_00740 [Spirosoma sordidisoli]